jgi:hypothetical protein
MNNESSYDDESIDSQLINFIENANVRLLTSGSFGITFEISGTNNMNNPTSFYNEISVRNIKNLTNKPQSKILMKISAIDDDDDKIGENVPFVYENSENGKSKKKNIIRISNVSTRDFINENLIHTKIYNKSNKYFQPLCPKIFTYYLLDIDKNEEGTLLKTIINMLDRSKILNGIIDPYNLYDKTTSLGVTFMEFLDGYETIDDIKDEYLNKEYNLKNTGANNSLINSCSKDYYNYIIRTMVGLIELALLGYNHADFHLSNIMYKRIFSNDPDYYPGLSDGGGRIMIIDFGQTVRLYQEEIDLFKEYIKSGDYFKILNKLYYNSKRANGLEIYDPKYSSFYKYITGMYSSYNSVNVINNSSVVEQRINSLIDIVFKSRELSKIMLKNKGLTKDKLIELKKMNDEYVKEMDELQYSTPCPIETINSSASSNRISRISESEIISSTNNENPKPQPEIFTKKFHIVYEKNKKHKKSRKRKTRRK